MVHRANFPEVYRMPSQRSQNSDSLDQGESDDENGSEVVDWKYKHPEGLKQHPMDGGDEFKNGEDFLNEEEEEEDDDRFQ